MNSIWNENLKLLKQRFPALYEELEPYFDSPSPFTVEPSKSGELTAIWNNKPLHSKYNPGREALTSIQTFNENSETEYKAAMFLSFGLGYSPSLFAKKHINIPLILVEPDRSFFIQALKHADFSDIFKHEKLILFCGAEFETIKSFLSSYTDKTIWIHSSPAQGEHSAEYFTKIKDCLKQNAQKEEINFNTLEKFGHLWLKNSCKNLSMLEKLDGIEKYKLLTNLPVTILAAGPSLQGILPKLKEVKERSIIVCVDTSVHSCLKQGIQPDFIILVDPQYACWRHLEFLSCPESILITESAAWPSVFRFNCKEIVLCSSLFPIGQYFEKHIGTKGKLGAGGSVTTTAWDFARIIGSKEIFIAGMDLGFPGKQTHIRGSQFEEASHRNSSRTRNAESDNIKSLISANPLVKKDYNGNPILTDKRMSLFSWWFETNSKNALSENVKTYSLTPESLFIDGITPYSLEKMLLKPVILKEKEEFFNNAQIRNSKIKESRQNMNLPSFKEVKENFVKSLEELISLSKKGINLCEKAIQNRTKLLEISSELSQIDSKILNSDAKEAAALVFPTQKQLDKLSKDLPDVENLKSIYFSRLIYSQILKSAKEYLKYL